MDQVLADLTINGLVHDVGKWILLLKVLIRFIVLTNLDFVGLGSLVSFNHHD